MCSSISCWNWRKPDETEEKPWLLIGLTKLKKRRSALLQTATTKQKEGKLLCPAGQAEPGHRRRSTLGKNVSRPKEWPTCKWVELVTAIYRAPCWVFWASSGSPISITKGQWQGRLLYRQILLPPLICTFDSRNRSIERVVPCCFEIVPCYKEDRNTPCLRSAPVGTTSWVSEEQHTLAAGGGPSSFTTGATP